MLNNIAKEHKKLIDSLLLLVPIITNIGFSSLWFYISPAKLMENYTVASIVFTGLFHSHVLATRSRELSRAWEWVHLGLSGFLIPLVMLHAWAAFAFKSF